MRYPYEFSYYILSLGCSKNLVDSERVNGALSLMGFSMSPSADEADIVIINTCGFITDAKKESIDTILEALSLKERRAEVRVAVIGCLSRRYRCELESELPEVDFFYGIPDAGFARAMCRAFGISCRISARTAPRLALDPTLPYRYIKIAEGCSNNCSYCAIPLIRGPRKAFPPSMIMLESRRAVEEGARELILVAQDTASYGYRGSTLERLAEKVSSIPGLEWLRVLYCHPDHVGESVIRMYERNPAVVKYIDIPFQHASGKILRAMGRSGDADAYLSLLAELRRRVPGIVVRSTFMVGFPGETESDFRELMDFIHAARIERAGCFVYSPEDGTPAALMKRQLPPGASRARYRALMRAQKRISAVAMESFVGRSVRVRVEERIDERTWAGRTEYDAPEVDGFFYLTADRVSLNSIVSARVTGCTEYDLSGVLL